MLHVRSLYGVATLGAVQITDAEAALVDVS